jgi:glyoxylase-like metal-dependent hydrolase (beta-lactamase superfamily II)
MSRASRRRSLGPSRRCGDLARLDRSLLHVFVAGPGEGEAIAVALPDKGWVLFDGCRASDGSIGLVDILDRWRVDGDPIHAYVLTHPHADHAKGIVELFERYHSDVRCIAVTPPLLVANERSTVTGRRIAGARVAKALERLERAVAA